jgi:hypothetical protein
MNNQSAKDTWREMSEMATKLKESLERYDLDNAMASINYLAELGEELREIIDDLNENDR